MKKNVPAKFRRQQREAIERYQDPCPECGLCNKEWKAECTKDWCPNLKGAKKAVR